MINWPEKVVVLTGASSGIGREMARLLVGKGAQLVMVARRGHVLLELQNEIAVDGCMPPLVVACDVGDSDQVANLLRQVEDRWGAADVLINNAGRGAYGPFSDGDLATYNSLVQTNLSGMIYCTKAFLPGMLIRGDGHLVFVSSIVAELPSPGHAVYCASKFAVNGLAESLEYELAPQGIHVHLVGPGLVRTEFPKRAGVPQKRFEQMPSKSASEVAQAVIQAVERGQRKSVPDFFGRQAIKLRRHFPNLAHCIFKRVFRSF